MNKKLKSIITIALISVLAVVLFVFAINFMKNHKPEPELSSLKTVSADITKPESSKAENKGKEPSEANKAAGESESEKAEPVSILSLLNVEDIEGKSVNLQSFEGKYVIINYWASWCPPCKAEMPELQTFYEKHKDDSDFVFLTVNATGGRETKESAVSYLDKNNYSFPAYFDIKGEFGAFLYHNGFTGIPVTLSFGPQGQAGGVISGSAGLESFENLLSRTKELHPAE